MKNKILNSLWMKSPHDYFKLFRKKKSYNAYFEYIKKQYYLFMINKGQTMSYDEFSTKITECLDMLYVNPDRYSANLWDLFKPDYPKNFNNYYKWHEKFLFLRFISYAADEEYININYSDAYKAKIDKSTEAFDILEIGGGIPHGLIYNIWKKGPAFCKSITYIDINVLHSDFVKWYCEQNKINLNQSIVQAAITPTVPSNKYDFVFAKDVFEHIDNPADLINQIIENCHENTILMLDLEHKGIKRDQHISPDLPPLKNILSTSGFVENQHFGDLGLWSQK